MYIYIYIYIYVYTYVYTYIYRLCSVSCDIENCNWNHFAHSQVCQALKDACFCHEN